MKIKGTVRLNLRWARKLWCGISPISLTALKQASELYNFSITMGDLLYMNGGWYVTHVGLLRLAHRKACAGIRVEAVPPCCDVPEKGPRLQVSHFSRICWLRARQSNQQFSSLALGVECGSAGPTR